MSHDIRAVLCESERHHVDAMLASMDSQPTEDFREGDFVHVAGSIRVGVGRWLRRGIYSVTRWTHDHLELKRYGERQKVEVPHGLTLTKYPMALVVLAERARERQTIEQEARS